MSKNYINLSEKHGLNPTILTCFYCGEETGELALLGKLPGDKEAPRHMCNSVKPCKKCEEKYKDHILIVEADTTNLNDPQPTGRWFGILKEAVSEEFRNSPVAFMKSDEFQNIIDNMNNDNN